MNVEESTIGLIISGLLFILPIIIANIIDEVRK